MEHYRYKVLSALSKLSRLFPFISSNLFTYKIVVVNSPISCIISDNIIYINKKIVEQESIAPLMFVLLSSALQNVFAVRYRIFNYKKVLYYLASNIYANELTFRLLSRVGIQASKDKLKNLGIEFFDDFKNILSKNQIEEYTINLLFKELDQFFSEYEKELKDLVREVLRVKNIENPQNLDKIKEKSTNLIEKLKKYLGEAASKRMVNYIIKNSFLYREEVQLYKKYKHKFDLSNIIKEEVKEVLDVDQIIIYGDRTPSDILERIEDELFYYKVWENMVQLIKKYATMEIRNTVDYNKYDVVKSLRYKKMLNLNNSVLFDRFKIVKHMEKSGVFFFIDTSFSIGDKDYKILTSAVKFAVKKLRNSRFFLLFFSDVLEKVFEFDTKNHKKIIDTLNYRYGYGGTNLKPALEYAINIIRKRGYRNSLAVVLTDGYIHDINIIYDMFYKFNKVLFVTIANIPDVLKKLNNVIVLRVPISAEYS